MPNSEQTLSARKVPENAGFPLLPWSDVFPVLLLVILAANFAFQQITWGDFWMHLAQGRYILEHRVVPTSEMFSYTYYGKTWFNWEWLHNVLIAFVWNGKGPAGIVALRIFLFCATLALFYFLLRRLRVSPSVSFLFSGAAFLMVQMRMSDRPHFLVYPLLVLSLYLLFAGERRRLTLIDLVCLSAVLACWRNVHPSWVLGVVLTILFYIDRSWRDRMSDVKKTLFEALGLIALATIAVSATPLPLDLSLHATLLFSGNSGVILDEWRSLFSYSHEWYKPFYLTFFLIVFSVLVSLRHAVRERPFYTLFVLVMFASAFVHLRFIPEACLVGMPLAAEFVDARKPLLSTRSSIAVTVLIFMLVFLIGEMNRSSSFFDKREASIDASMVPLHAANFMRDHGLGGNVYGHYTGSMDFLMGYLYPRIKVAWDMRIPAVYPHDFAQTYWAIHSPEDFKEFVLPFPLDYILLGHADIRLDTQEDVVLERLLLQEGYDLIYFDKFSALYRSPRKSSGDAGESGAPDAFKVLTRWNSDRAALLKNMRDGRFDQMIDEVLVLKRRTAGRDDFYREVIIGLYRNLDLSDQQKGILEELF